MADPNADESGGIGDVNPYCDPIQFGIDVTAGAAGGAGVGAVVVPVVGAVPGVAVGGAVGGVGFLGGCFGSEVGAEVGGYFGYPTLGLHIGGLVGSAGLSAAAASRVSKVGSNVTSLDGIIPEANVTCVMNNTAKSVEDKLAKYLLNPNHPVGASKAKWFKEALGFNQENADVLAKQIVFDPKTAIQTAVTEYGTKFNQVIPITGANGKVIDVPFVWIKNKDDVVRFVTGIPTKK